MRILQEMLGYPVRDTFLRLTQIVQVLMVERAQDVTGLLPHGAGLPDAPLSFRETYDILALRIDLT